MFPMPGADFFERSRAVLGEDAFNVLSQVRVAVFGLGGVGGWCVEALARTGVSRFLLVDGDAVVPSNVNRQTVATAATVGMRKAFAMRERVLSVNPSAEVEVRDEFYSEPDAGSFPLAGFDFVIDAIDSIDAKAALARAALACPQTRFFSSMGAARRTDPLSVRVSRFRKVEGDGLAKALRGRFRKTGGIPERDFLCVHSVQPPVCSAPGSVMQVVAAFGLALASLVVSGPPDSVRP